LKRSSTPVSATPESTWPWTCRSDLVILGHSIHSYYTRTPVGKWVVQGDHHQIVLSDTVVAEAERARGRSVSSQQELANSPTPAGETMRKFCVG
jgi:hypothetical protein